MHDGAGTVEECSCREKDWVGDRRSCTLAWGLPTVALLVAVFAPASVRTLVWPAALVWMGAACLANARRCGRTHCYLTGPFFLLAAVAVLAHGSGLPPLGPNGWAWLGGAVAIGTALLWSASETLRDRYVRRKALPPRRISGTCFKPVQAAAPIPPDQIP
jgi:hypothetical protein